MKAEKGSAKLFNLFLLLIFIEKRKMCILQNQSTSQISFKYVAQINSVFAILQSHDPWRTMQQSDLFGLRIIHIKPIYVMARFFWREWTSFHFFTGIAQLLRIYKHILYWIIYHQSGLENIAFNKCILFLLIL